MTRVRSRRKFALAALQDRPAWWVENRRGHEHERSWLRWALSDSERMPDLFEERNVRASIPCGLIYRLKHLTAAEQW